MLRSNLIIESDKMLNVFDYFVILMAALFSAIPPILAKKYVDNNKKNLLLVIYAILANALVVYFYIYLCSVSNAANMYTVVKIVSIIMVFVFGYIFLQEKISKKQLLGIIFGIIAIVLVSK